MIGKIFEKKSIKALFKYVKKDDAKYIGGSLLMSNEDEFLKNFAMYQGKKEIKKPAIHIVLSAAKSDGWIDDSKWLDAAELYLNEMGFDTEKHAWSVVKHNDTDNPHIHIICSKVDIDGVVWKSNFSKRRNILAVAKVESELDFWNKQSSKQVQKNKDNMLNPYSLKPSPDSLYHSKKRKGDNDFFKEIQDKLNETVNQNPNITLSQFQAILSKNNIHLEAKSNQNSKGNVALVFSSNDPITNEKHSFKASSLGSKFLWKNLNSKMGYINDLNSNAATVLAPNNQNQNPKVSFSNSRP